MKWIPNFRRKPLPTMTLLEADEIKAENPPPDFLMVTANNMRFDRQDFGKQTVQLSSYQMLPWITQAVSYVARYCATVQLDVFELDGEEKNHIVNHPFELLMNRPNPTQSRFRFLEATFANLQLAGNAYWWLNRIDEDTAPMEMYVLPSHRIEPIPGGTIGLVQGYEWDAGKGQKIFLDPWEILHFYEYHPTKMLIGMSKTESIGNDINKDVKASEYDMNYFGKDNAKPEGILHFEGRLDPGDRKALDDRFVRRHGGVKRSLAIAEGDGDLNYIQLATTHADMEFLAGRGFTRDEIYNQFAPGLASILAVNATEANSRTGKATLMELGIWPTLVSVHERITNNILPAYGSGIVCEFEDVRLTDQAMELSEQEHYAKTHTIDEVRQKYYNSEEIGDERGEMLIAQIGQSDTTLSLRADVTQTEQVGQPSGQVETAPAAPAEAPEEAKAFKPVPSMKQLILDEVAQWQRFVTKRLKAGSTLESMREFQAEHIPPGLYGAIEGALSKVREREGVKAIFDDAMTWEQLPSG